MNDTERDKKIEDIHETVIRMDQALLKTKIPERVNALEQSKAWIMGAAAALGAFSGWVSSRMNGK